VLQWAPEPGCEWDRSTTARAALGGELAALQWAREQHAPCAWNEHARAWAVQGGHLEA
jgi:hypothetical protein